MKGGSWKITGRGKYGRVTAEWGERGTATTHKVTAGDKEPELALRHRYPTEAEAQNAAAAALERSRRASGKISIELGGFWGDLMAEAKVDLQGIKPELTGEWLITRVQHRLTDTLTTSFDAERDNEEDKE
jgi:phage protein D